MDIQLLLFQISHAVAFSYPFYSTIFTSIYYSPCPLNQVIVGIGYPSASQFIDIVLPSMMAVSIGSSAQRGATK